MHGNPAQPADGARRRTDRKAVLAAVIPLMLLADLNAAAAQSNLSADQIITLLRPSAPGATRGIHPLSSPTNDVPASPPEVALPTNHAGAIRRRPSPPDTPAANADSSMPSVSLTVIFATGSARLTASATHTLDELGRALSSATLAGYKFRVEGHTDTVGGADANKALSQARALAVVAYLANRFNIDRSRLIPIGMGQDGLLVATPPETPEPRNRRVQVVNLGT